MNRWIEIRYTDQWQLACLPNVKEALACVLLLNVIKGPIWPLALKRHHLVYYFYSISLASELEIRLVKILTPWSHTHLIFLYKENTFKLGFGKSMKMKNINKFCSILTQQEKNYLFFYTVAHGSDYLAAA